VTIQAPQLDITTVAAGGGSKLTFRSGTFRVGPESVGSQPGPVCYRKGGKELSVTDANALLGRVSPAYFPKIFGPTEDQPLDIDAVRIAFEAEADTINFELGLDGKDDSKPKLTPEEVALGYVRVANEAMCRPIREITESKGVETAAHALAAFGGAGPQHACAIARALGMRRVFVHRFCGILSAYGMGLADVVAEAQRPFAASALSEDGRRAARRASDELRARVVSELAAQGFAMDDIATETLLNLRYEGTDTAIMTSGGERRHGADGGDAGVEFEFEFEFDFDFVAAFGERFRREYGFDLAGSRDVVIDDVRVRGVGSASLLTRVPVDVAKDDEPLPEPDSVAEVYFEGGLEWTKTPVFLAEALKFKHAIRGPAVVMNGTATCVIEPGCVASVTEFGDLSIDVHPTPAAEREEDAETAIEEEKDEPTPEEEEEEEDAYQSPDAVQLSIFNNRFMGIAEQMGRTLQRTSTSTNIKERLDFSCALFGPDGGLVANAPHVPVHLGAMSSTVKWQLDRWNGSDERSRLNPGDVLVTNHPSAGGSHLPDITVITPVFRDGECVFLVASRGHHADVGGMTPGSMPPFSRTLADEGAAIKTFKLVEGGVFMEEGITALLTKPPDGGPGTRKLRDNLSDLAAQVAANQRGIALIDELIDEHGLCKVQAYMRHVQDNAELAVRDTVREYASRLKRERPTASDAADPEHRVSLTAEDKMDDGSVVKLTLTLDTRDGSAVFDFTGTSDEVRGNWNAPPAVTTAAVIYCVRCLVNQEIPLNQGCLSPITIVVPDGTFLSPSDGAAVVGGNVLTSQRVTDVCFAAFEACANSQARLYLRWSPYDRVGVVNAVS